MTKIDELLKGEKVEWKKLESLLEYEQPTKYIVKSTEYNDRFDTPVLTAGKTYILGFTDEKENIYEANKENPVIIFDDFTSGNHWVDFKFKIKSSAMKILKPRVGVNLRYCYHYIQTIDIDTTEHKRLWISKFSQIKIPVPSIETQEKIAKTLDKFTECVTQLQAELQAELQARVKQYEYYRDELLSEDYLNKLTKEFYNIDKFKEFNYFKLEDLVNIIVGSDVPKNNFSKIKNEKYKIPIYSNGTEENSLYGYTDTAKVFEDSVTISARGTIGYVSLKNEPYYPIVRLICLIPKNELLNIKFLYYFLQQYKFSYVHTGIPSLTSDMVKNIKFPLPNILIQNIVVEILDKFQSLVSKTQGLLPQEIEQRQKQYEFYREKLLTFDKNMVERNGTILASSYFSILKEACDVSGIKFGKLSNKKLNDICDVRDGTHDSPKKQPFGKYLITSKNIKDGKVDYFNSYFISEYDYEQINKRSKVNIGDILFTMIGTLGEIAHISEEPDYAIKNVGLIKPNNSVLSRYLFHYLKSESVSDYVEKNKSKGSQVFLSLGKLRNLDILVPPLYVQEYVVSILDKFDSLINDINEGLPKEIELRQKQYEYYREKLLDFPR